MSPEDICLVIEELLDGVEWSPDTLQAIADLLRANGYRIRDIDDIDPDEERSNGPGKKGGSHA